VLEFDPQCNFIQAWGGPGAGYDWPETEHGIYIDPKGFVWIGGNGNDDQILKFTKAGKFVMQIGKGGQKKTNADTKNLWEPADVFLYAKTNELFVADGYGNKRIVVFDPDTGAFKRMWGAFGGTPMDDPPAPAGQQLQPQDARVPRFIRIVGLFNGTIRNAAPFVRGFERQSLHCGSDPAEAREQTGPEVHLHRFCTNADGEQEQVAIGL